MSGLARRSTARELMDDAALPPAIYRRCIDDLAGVNRLTMTHGATLRWLAKATRHYPPGAEFSVLDVAYGQGDLLRAIGGWAAKAGFRVRLSGVDLNPRSARAAEAATPPAMTIAYHVGDVFAHHPAEKPDFIVTSQFTHHLTDEQLLAFLRWLEAEARRGWHITDLHRHPIPYHSFRWIARAARWHWIVGHDGTISIARGFRREEWAALLAEAGIDAEIAWHVPFRHSVSRIR
jgi:2-polyprenyl-3-methyl-5-hydroxy-6-metoxy-1,4-benzoquinol methylase